MKKIEIIGNTYEEKETIVPYPQKCTQCDIPGCILEICKDNVVWICKDDEPNTI